MSDSYVRNVIEAALLAAGGPLPVTELARLFDDGVRPSAPAVRAAIAALAAEYEGRGIELKETASGFRIQVRRELATQISRLWPERAARYSRALLETLALIAYRQPITRAEIEAVRGVTVNPNIIRTVIERSWVRVVGHRDVPGHPELLGTTREFLDYFGLKSLDELPPLAELRALGDINLELALAGEAAGATPAQGVAAQGAAVGDSAAQAADEGADEGADGPEEDELPADGDGSEELVAGPLHLER
jgi:segregation and condensation protein B